MSNPIDPEEFRKHSKLFDLLDEAGRARLMEVSLRESHADGDVLMEEGASGVSFYVILDGAVVVLIDDGEAKKEVARLTIGAFVGEIAALMNEPRSATVVCDGEVDVLRFDSPPVQDILADYPKVRQALVKLALKRSEDNLQQILDG